MSNKFDKRVLYDFIQEKYGVTKLPKQFFIKMASIYKGKLEGLTRPILPEHMYDMWVQKSNFLDKVYMKNISKGKKMEGYLRINYDLAILMSKYDDYLKWLDRQKSLSVDNEKVKDNVSTENVIHMQINEKNNINKNDNNDNLSDVLDELI